jgi:hypothetical protein
MKIHRNINGIQTHVRSCRSYNTLFYHPKLKASWAIFLHRNISPENAVYAVTGGCFTH